MRERGVYSRVPDLNNGHEREQREHADRTIYTGELKNVDKFHVEEV